MFLSSQEETKETSHEETKEEELYIEEESEAEAGVGAPGQRLDPAYVERMRAQVALVEQRWRQRRVIENRKVAL